MEFYLDYVGCKVCFSSNIVSIFKGFISTMWDVKQGITNIYDWLSEFYLDYVGCKAAHARLR